MSFTLASTEEDPIELQLNENAPIQLGRTLLNIHDTKVSRQQVEISLKDGKVVVKQLGINPSVIKKPDGKAWLLKKDESTTLDPNDHLLLIATATSDKHVEFKLLKKGTKRRIQEEDEADVAEIVPKKKFKVEEDLNNTIEDEKKEDKNNREAKNSSEKNNAGDAVYEKEIKELRSILPEVSLEDIQTAILLAEGSVEMALQSLLDTKTKASEPVKEQANGNDKNKQAKSNQEENKKDVVMVDDVPALTPPTSPLREENNKEGAADNSKPAMYRSDSELAQELQRQWEEELRNAPQEYSNNEVKTAQQFIAEEVDKLKLVADNCGMFYDELSFPTAFGVRMALDVKSIDKWKAKQLGINPSKPIIIQLKFSSEFTDDKDPPNFLIFQSGDKDLSALSLKDYETDFGAMQWFLETRLTKVLLKNWANKPVKPAQRNIEEDKSKDDKAGQVAVAKKEEKKNKAKEAGVDENKLKQLMAMGFTEDKSIEALVKCKGNLDSATEMLLTGKAPAAEPEDPPAVTQLINMGFKRAEAVNALAAFNNDVKKAVASLLGEEVPDSQEEAAPVGRSKYGKLAKKKAKKYSGFGRGKGHGGVKNDDLDAPPSDEEEDPIEALEYKSDQERLFADDAPFLVRLYNYMLYRFTTSPKYCMICDKEINLETGYKLPVCNRKSCNNVYNTSACGGNIINEIKNQPEVVELLLHLLSCAATGKNARGFNRNGVGLSPKTNGYGYGATYGMAAAAPKQTFEPFPHNLGFNYSDGSQNVDLLIKILDKIPSIKEMQACASDEQLKVILDDIHSLCFPLLKWVIRSNRAHISYVPKEKQIESMKTPYQFQLVNSFPEHEKKFLEWKEQAAILKAKRGDDDVNGSYWSFHGSPVENWHSIIRTGLRSGFVRGIYHAQQAMTSWGYMQVGAGNATGWPNGSWNINKQISCISLIEVADFRSENDGKIKGGTGKVSGATGVGFGAYSAYGEDIVVNVAMIDSLVVTRFLFFYPSGPNFQPPNYDMPGYNPMGHPAFNPASLGPVANKLGVKDFMFIPKNEEKFDYPFGDYDYVKKEDNNMSQ